MFSYKSISTKGSTGSKIINFLSLPNKFICIGKPTQWTNSFDDERIPEPNENSLIIEPIVYIKPYKVLAVYRSPCGDLSANGSKWNQVDIERISINNSIISPPISHLYVQVHINPDQYNTESFRMIGLYTHTELVRSANPNLISYEPIFISNPGLLHWIAYSTPIYRLENKSHILDLVIPL